MSQRIADETRRANGRKGGRPPTGSPKWMRNPETRRMQWYARVTFANGVRRPVQLDPAVPHADEPRARALALEVVALVRERGLAAGGETLEEYLERWLQHLESRGKTRQAADVRSRMRRVLRVLGRRVMAKVTRAEVEDVRDGLDAEVRRGAIAWKTAMHVWSDLRTLFRAAVHCKDRPLRVRPDDPTLGVEAPDQGAKKSKVYLWPSEFSALVSCSAVPIEWRRAFALATYLYLRAGELGALDWEDVDLEHRVVHVHRAASRDTGAIKSTKTGEGRRVPIEPALVPLLTAMSSETGGKGGVSPIRSTDRKLSRQLRRCLWIAGVTRADLHTENDPTRKAMTFHDLRATGLTWCAARGDQPMKIEQRAGHRSFSTTEGYIREAENLRDADFGTPFPALPVGLVGTAAGFGQVLDGGREEPPAQPKISLFMVEAPGIEPA
jgi:integrase